MKSIDATILLLLPATCLASGWTDYELDIGDGYTLVRGNSGDTTRIKDAGFVSGPGTCAEGEMQ